MALKGSKLSEEHKERIGAANRGDKNPFFGKKHSEESRKKMSERASERIGEKHPQFGKHPSEETKEKISLALKGKVVSEETRKKLGAALKGNKNPMFGIRHYGKDNPNWKLTKTEEDRLDDRSYTEYQIWRLKVFERDNFTCQKCGSIKSGTLNAHHIEGYSFNKELRTTVENGITFCVPCHKDFHRQYGIESTAEKVKEFLKEK